MKRKTQVILRLCLTLGMTSLMSLAHADTTIPVADFFKKAQYNGSPVLSPDGQSMAVLTPRNGRFVLAIIRLDSRTPKVIASDPDWDVVNPVWVNNERLVFSLSKGSDAVFEEQKGGGLFAVNIDGSRFRKLTPTVKEAMANNVPYKPYALLSRVSETSNDLIVVNNERGRDTKLGASDVFQLDTTTGRTTLLTFNNPGKVADWVLDHQHVVRVGLALDVEPGSKRIKQTVYYRDNADAPWKSIYQAYVDEGQEMRVLGFDFDNKAMLVAGRFHIRDKEAVYLWDFAKQAPGEMLADHALADVEAVRFDERRKKIVGVLVDAMKRESIFFDEDYARLDAALRASFPGQDVSFQWSGKNVVVVTQGANNPGSVYFYDSEKKTIEPLYVMKPELEGKKLSETKFIDYKARDGLTIPAYLTLPEGKDAKKLPLIAYVHGGPHARDKFGYNPMTQMLASRGYAVLQPQFRMSTGFGWAHHKVGWKQWGLAMQDDITDGVNALVKQGIVDKDRVCIIGASYGGYATMYGLIKDPDLYKCGVNWVGVTDVKMLFTVTWSDMSGPYMDNLGALMHGDPKTDEAYFTKASAIGNADKIKAPVLMGYGSEDVRVPLIHGERMRDKLLAQGNTVEWVVMVGEEHNWYRESNRIKWGEMVLRFVDRYIGDGASAGKK
ncbi:S9 family peptidase [Undibacterium griseum]|uniref:Prolyl oligopeptidase family serine peptidase n=1 Tax=Undibacterium griseum TaxID=2762295 RepID=A0ABR6YRG0_9BURK|nr:S9 family peptidase [Undibacterium griseum]MBC3886500.1 prolyl oligopeptidase family serine peptidase [Undibacterium griseum]